MCKVEVCARKPVAKGLCRKHYARFKRHGDPTAGATERGAAVAFVQKALAMETDACIEWPFYTCKTTGYPRMQTKNRMAKSVSREILERAIGPAPSEKHVAAHKPDKCHNRGCINKRHLRWATHSENMLDKRLDGTSRAGSSHHNSKLTADDVRAIRADKRTHQAISEDYPISRRHVSDIKRRLVWKHV